MKVHLHRRKVGAEWRNVHLWPRNILWSGSKGYAYGTPEIATIIFQSHVGRCNMVPESCFTERDQIIMDGTSENLCLDLSVIGVDVVIYLSARIEQFTFAKTVYLVCNVYSQFRDPRDVRLLSAMRFN